MEFKRVATKRVARKKMGISIYLKKIISKWNNFIGMKNLEGRVIVEPQSSQKN